MGNPGLGETLTFCFHCKVGAFQFNPLLLFSHFSKKPLYGLINSVGLQNQLCGLCVLFFPRISSGSLLTLVISKGIAKIKQTVTAVEKYISVYWQTNL